MLELSIPGRGTLQLHHLVLDYNGTLACEGALLPEVPEQLLQLAESLHVHIITADTFGTVQQSCSHLPCTVTVLQPENQTEAKADYVSSLGPESTVAMGNGSNDASMLSRAALSFAIVGPEGASNQALLASDVVFTSIHDALNALIQPKRTIATLRS